MPKETILEVWKEIFYFSVFFSCNGRGKGRRKGEFALQRRRFYQKLLTYNIIQEIYFLLIVKVEKG